MPDRTPAPVPPAAPTPAADLIEYAAGIIVAKSKEPHTAPYHWAAALWEAGMLHPPGQIADAAAYERGVAAGRTAAAADLPRTTERILAWLSRHGLSDTPGVGAVLPAIRRDILGICSACGPGPAAEGTDHAG